MLTKIVVQNTSNLEDFYEIQPSIPKMILDEFKKQLFNNIFFNNLSFLLENSDVVKFNKDRWIYRPEFFCVDYYGHLFFSHIILLCNNIGTIFRFHPDNMLDQYIIAPKKNVITDIIVNNYTY